MRWFRFYNDAVDDEKLRLLSFEDRWHYTAVLCLKSDGILDTKADELRERKIALKLGLSLEEAQSVKGKLCEVGLINTNWHPKGWKKRQYEHDSSANRTRAYREKNKVKQQLKERHGDVTVTTTDTDTDTDTERDKQRGLFPDFWTAYPRKENKQRAQTAFQRLSVTDQQKALDGVVARDWGYSKEFIMLPTTYLNGKRWDDEQTPKQGRGNNGKPTVADIARHHATDESWANQ